MSGVEWCVAGGIAIPDRLGIAGLSYGGYMAGWAITQTDRFAASVAISVVADYRSFHLTSEVAMWDEMMLRTEWDEPGGLYDDRSPVVHARKARTPTLVIAGELDRCTPVSQGEMLFGALAAAACETELVSCRAKVTCPWRGRRARGDPANAGLVRSVPGTARLGRNDARPNGRRVRTFASSWIA